MPDERVRLLADGGRSARKPRVHAYGGSRGGRCRTDQHLLGSREAPGKTVLRARPLQGAQTQAARNEDRRGRVRCKPGRRGHRQTRAPTWT